MKGLSRLMAVLHKELLQLSRDKLTFGMIAGVPLMQLMLFGFAINTDVRHLYGAVANQAGTQLASQLVMDLEASQVVDFRYRVATAEELEALLKAGRISLGLYIPPDFDRRTLDNERKAAQLLVDGSDPIIVGVAQQLTAVPLSFESQLTDMNGRPNSLVELRNFYNPERRSAFYIVPGLIGVILTSTMVLFTGVAIVREKERGNLELLINTPVRPIELMVGKILPYVMIGLIQVSLILGLGSGIFSVPIQAHLWEVYLGALVFIATNLSLGLLISTLAETQFQAMQMTFFVFLPSILLSGFMFPFEGMPKAAQWFAEIIPLTHFNRLSRGLLLRGASLRVLWPDLLALLAFMAVTMTLAVSRFNKRLD